MQLDQLRILAQSVMRVGIIFDETIVGGAGSPAAIMVFFHVGLGRFPRE
jgi:uncharacterized membrane protein (Fun14 family)